jgi:hypothetical protein
MDDLEIKEVKKDLAQDTFLEKWPNWLRWLLFLPSAVIVPALFFLIQSIFQSWFLDIGPDAFYLVLMRGIVYGAGFVLVGSMVAPNYQKAICILLLIILSMVIGIGIFSAIITSSPISHSIEGLLMLASGGYATYYIFHEI